MDVEPTSPLPVLRLVRLYLSTGTFATGLLPTGERIFTVEPAWTGGGKGSCIPPGLYRCRWGYFHDGGYPVYEITGVEGRSRILFHIGNWPFQTKGCPLVGDGIHDFSEHGLGVTNSKITLRKLHAAFARDFEQKPFLLHIVGEPPALAR